MTMERVIELWGDCELQEFISRQCCRLSHDEEIQRDCFACAWAWISASAPDDMEIETIKRYAGRAVVNEYKRELRQRRLTRTLLDICCVEESEILDFEPYGRRGDAGELVKPSK